MTESGIKCPLVRMSAGIGKLLIWFCYIKNTFSLKGTVGVQLMVSDKAYSTNCFTRFPPCFPAFLFFDPQST